jgi:hypothetical protein
MAEEPNSEEEWPPPQARLQGILWRAEGHLLRGEYGQAAAALRETAGLGADELVAGLRHAAAAGWRAQEGQTERARRQLERARGRLAPFLPESHGVEVAAVLDALESAHGELA